MTWLLCTLLGHNRVSVHWGGFVTDHGHVMLPVEHTCRRRGCKWSLTVWEREVLR